MSRRFQFSLKALLVATAVVGMLCARLASELIDKRREDAVVRSLLARSLVANRNGDRPAFQVDYDQQIPFLERQIPTMVPAGKGWFREIFGNAFARAVAVHTNGGIYDADLEAISALDGLDVLYLGSGRPAGGLGGVGHITDAGLRHLRRLTRLKILVLYGCDSITDAGIAEFKNALPGCEVVQR
jgi:hypothetical protein